MRHTKDLHLSEHAPHRGIVGSRGTADTRLRQRTWYRLYPGARADLEPIVAACGLRVSKRLVVLRFQVQLLNAGIRGSATELTARNA